MNECAEFHGISVKFCIQELWYFSLGGWGWANKSTDWHRHLWRHVPCMLTDNTLRLSRILFFELRSFGKKRITNYLQIFEGASAGFPQTSGHFLLMRFKDRRGERWAADSSQKSSLSRIMCTCFDITWTQQGGSISLCQCFASFLVQQMKHLLTLTDGT